MKKTWNAPKEKLPPEGRIVIVHTNTSGTYTAIMRTMKNHKSPTWKLAIGSLPLDSVRAWCEIPKLDI